MEGFEQVSRGGALSGRVTHQDAAASLPLVYMAFRFLQFCAMALLLPLSSALVVPTVTRTIDAARSPEASWAVLNRPDGPLPEELPRMELEDMQNLDSALLDLSASLLRDNADQDLLDSARLEYYEMGIAEESVMESAFSFAAYSR